MPKIPFKFSRYLAALLLAWLFALLWYLGNNPAPDWANLLPETETLTVWLWRLAAAFTLAALAALLPHRFYRRAADVGAKFFRLSRPVQVCGAFALSLLLLEGLMLLLPVLQDHWHLDKKFWETGTFWTLAALLISSPVTFVVWRFRDENQSKDINLKEFQKISEWVTGAHFQEEKHSEKFSGSLPENADAAQPSERSREYYRPAASTQALHTFSKQDGAVGLQIAAVYNLLPFYRGDYGQAFEKPSVHLLHSAWKVLQHDILQKLDKADDEIEQSLSDVISQALDKTSYGNKRQQALIKQLHQRADSPLGQAITRVLLACDYAKKPLLHRHLEILPGICLSGMNFNLTGLEHKILRDTLFCGQDLTGAQWQGVRGIWEWNLNQAVLDWANLSSTELHGANLTDTKLYQANLSSTQLKEANLSDTQLDRANLSSAQLDRANLSSAQLDRANLSSAQLKEANLSSAQLKEANLSGAQLDRANLSGAQLDRANLSGAQLYKTNLSNAQLNLADLSSAQLKEANLSGARLYKVNLSNAQLRRANLSSAQLDRANLSSTQLNWANLNRAQLRRANLSDAELGWVNLSSSVLCYASLLNAKNLTVKQLLAAEMLAGSLTDADNFSQYAQAEQQQLRKKGLIVLYKGIDTIPKYLLCRHQKTNNWGTLHPTNSIPFPINLAATQAANPDWQIFI